MKIPGLELLAFNALMWLGWWYDVAGARNIIHFLVGLGLIVVFIAALWMDDAHRAAGRKKFDAVPRGVLFAYDAYITAFFVWHGAWFTAVAYVAKCVLLRVALMPVPSRDAAEGA